MTSELAEYLNIIEQKLQTLIRDIQNIRVHLTQQHQAQRTGNNPPTFFDALSSEDHVHAPQFDNKPGQM